MYLLDTGVVFELRNARAGQTDPRFSGWAAGLVRQNLFISALTLLELDSGATRTAQRDKAAGLALRQWIDNQVLPAFEGRILPVDTAVVRRRAQLSYADARDGLLAATALEHGLTLATRHPGAFKTGRVKLLNPWAYTPDAVEEDGDWRQAAKAGPLWLKNLFVRA
ncbi:MAG: PIN domain-containing protein [Pseudomonadota bacterium]|jgi:predicted nucleic acid-binding protein|uniref:VapC toxin protein n=1 Tax=hydrothermal vent metagenome TaxID=652676 RepID=A0A160TGB6_9ZZZZ